MKEYLLFVILSFVSNSCTLFVCFDKVVRCMRCKRHVARKTSG